MGRRPNALVSEYFARGAKCSDTSNRYAHTCKGCGENFPKGRVDSLMSHLLRRCSSTSQVERVLIYRAIQQQNPEPPLLDDMDHQSTSLTGAAGDAGFQSKLPPPVQYQNQQQQSALDTLAEVSRQHLDISSQERLEQQAPIVREPPGSGRRQNAEEDFYAQLRDAVKATPDDPVPENAPETTEQSSTLEEIPTGHALVPLIETASAANEQLEHTTSGQENLDPALQDHEAPVRASLPIQEVTELGAATIRDDFDRSIDASTVDATVNDHQEYMTWISSAKGPVEAHPSSHNLTNIMATSKQPISFLPKIVPALAHTFTHNLSDVMAASKQPVAGFGPLRNGTKARSKFSDNRRKQVQEVRKRGACIRCRMLKKPCSEGTPCNTCKTVGSARLWKGSCLRTRLSDEFTLWSAGIFNSKAKNAVANAFQGLEAPSTEAAIEVRLLPNSDLYMTLASNKYNQNNLARQRAAMNAYNGADPDLVLQAQFDSHTTSPSVYLLEEEAGVLSKLEEYVNRVLDSCIHNESSVLLKATLQQAQMLIREEGNEANTAALPANGSVRTCYTFQHQLLRNVVELWVETTILTQQKNDADGGIHARLPSQEGEEISQNLPPENLLLIQSQLRAALESRCTTLSKGIMNELERRLLQRQQVSRFATFISAVILLNCVERMTGLFRAEDEDESNPWPQGSHFADLLIMLLRMRGLPPKTISDAQGRLVVMKPSLSASASALKLLENEAAAMAASWLDPLGVQFEDLVRVRDAEDPARGEMWDLRFVARALLPDVQ